MVMQKRQKLFCRECGLSYHHICSNLGHKQEQSSILWKLLGDAEKTEADLQGVWPLVPSHL